LTEHIFKCTHVLVCSNYEQDFGTSCKKKDVVKTMFANTVNPVYKGHSQEPENCTHRNLKITLAGT